MIEGRTDDVSPFFKIEVRKKISGSKGIGKTILYTINNNIFEMPLPLNCSVKKIVSSFIIIGFVVDISISISMQLNKQGPCGPNLSC